MRILPTLLALATMALSHAVGAETPIAGDFTDTNPRIDFASFLTVAQTAYQVREHRRLSETKFIEMSKLPDVVILDARSRDKFELLHVAGAINLPYADISEPSLAKVLPRKDQIILIYCNNNFAQAPVAFASKRDDASLNISTYIALQSYGYTQIYELGPLLDVHTTAIPLIGNRG